MKDRLNIRDGDDNALLESIITSVSRQIDDECNRRFYAASETRYFAADEDGRLFVPDLLSVTVGGLKTDADGDGVYEQTWAATDFALYPLNALLDGAAYREIRTTPGGNYSFPVAWWTDGALVQITGSFGYAAATPPVIEDACLFQAALLFHAKDAPEGVSGAGEFQQTITAVGLHPFTRRMIFPYKRLVAA